MPELKASGDIFTLQGDAAYSEGIVHGRVGGAARITISAELEACHGIDAAIAAEALAEIQGMASVLLPALRAQGSAFARIGANASIQLSPNIFDKAGLTIDLQAQAQAAVAGRIAIGLDFETIAELARGQLSDLAYELFIAFLSCLLLIKDTVCFRCGADLLFASCQALHIRVHVLGILFHHLWRITFRIDSDHHRFYRITALLQYVRGRSIAG